MSDKKNIFQKINAVMAAVKYVQKDARVLALGSSYSAVTHDQLVSVLRDAMVSEGIVVYPEQKSSAMPIMRDPERKINMHLYSGDYVIHFVNIDDPNDRLSVPVNAQAADNGDKAPGKALTYATKIAMLKVFSMETGESDESRAEVAAQNSIISTEAVKELTGLISQHSIDEGKFLQAVGAPSFDAITLRQFATGMAMLKKRPPLPVPERKKEYAAAAMTMAKIEKINAADIVREMIINCFSPGEDLTAREISQKLMEQDVEMTAQTVNGFVNGMAQSGKLSRYKGPSDRYDRTYWRYYLPHEAGNE